MERCTECDKKADTRHFVEVDAGGTYHHDLCDECYKKFEYQQWKDEYVIKD